MVLSRLNLLFATLIVLALSGVRASRLQGHDASNRCGNYGLHVDIGEDEPNFTFEELWDLQNTFLTQFMYPNNALQARSINSDLLAPNVSRSSPIGSLLTIYSGQRPGRHFENI